MSATITITHEGQTQTLDHKDTEALDDGIQRVSNIYFAKKRVTDNNGSLSVSFERINEGILGRQVYLLVETTNMSGLELEVRIRPADNTLTGNTNDLALMQNGAQVTIFTTKVGDYDPLNDRDGSHAHYNTNLDTLSNKAIIKLEIRPQGRATFDTWATNIGSNTAGLLALVERKDKQPCAFREEAEERTGQETFLNDTNFAVRNKNVYEIYHTRNTYNQLQMQGNNRRQIGKLLNSATTDVVYIYHTPIDNERELATSTISSVSGRTNGNKHIQRLPQGYTSSGAAAGGEAQTNYYYPDGRIITEGSHAGARYISYGLDGTQVSLITMPDSLNLTVDTILFAYSFSGTQRRHCNPDCFAGFMVVLGESSIAVQSTGMCFADATSYPSVSHPNGDSVDTIYLANRANAQTILTAFVNAGFSQVIAGTNYTWLTGAHLYRADHNNHLHSGNFSTAFTEELIV